jgi:hypothetical protein
MHFPKETEEVGRVKVTSVDEVHFGIGWMVGEQLTTDGELQRGLDEILYYRNVWHGSEVPFHTSEYLLQDAGAACMDEQQCSDQDGVIYPICPGESGQEATVYFRKILVVLNGQ